MFSFRDVVSDRHVHKYGVVLVKDGVGGINPTVLWVDAAVAVIEAAGIYFQYCAAQEGTKQLREFNHSLKVTLAQKLKIDEMKLESLRKKQQGRLNDIERILDATRCQAQLRKQEVRDQFSLLQDMRGLIKKERDQLGSFSELIGLQVCIDSCIDATLALLLSYTGE